MSNPPALTVAPVKQCTHPFHLSCLNSSVVAGNADSLCPSPCTPPPAGDPPAELFPANNGLPFLAKCARTTSNKLPIACAKWCAMLLTRPSSAVTSRIAFTSRLALDVRAGPSGPWVKSVMRSMMPAVPQTSGSQ